MMNKIFICTLYCGEGDFQKCIENVNKQKDVIITHKIISYLPEIEANNELYQSFMKEKNNFDVFIRLDADMVLIDDFVLSRILKKFNSNKDITKICTYVNDYFTNENIIGMHCFTKDVNFIIQTNKLFCDRKIEFNHKIVINPHQISEKDINPAALHAHYANEKQAFFFGIHRSLKQQYHILNKVKKAYKKYNDDIRAYALLGFNHVNKFNVSNFNYNHSNFQNTFNYVKENFEKLKNELL